MRVNFLRNQLDRRSTDEQQLDFLEQLRECGQIVKSCELSNISYPVFYNWRENDELFQRMYELTVKEIIDKVDGEIYQRAVEGYDVPVYQAGKLVGYKKERSDTLLQFMAKGWMPEKYGNNINVNKNVNHNNTVLIMPSNGREIENNIPAGQNVVRLPNGNTVMKFNAGRKGNPILQEERARRERELNGLDSPPQEEETTDDQSEGS